MTIPAEVTIDDKLKEITIAFSKDDRYRLMFVFDENNESSWHIIDYDSVVQSCSGNMTEVPADIFSRLKEILNDKA